MLSTVNAVTGEGEERVGEWLAAIGSFIGFFVLMILIFVGAYYASKLMGKHYSMQGSSSDAMKVVDKLVLGRDQYLVIVEAGEKTLLLGVSPQQIETLAELNGEAFADLPRMQESTDFISLLKSRIKK